MSLILFNFAQIVQIFFPDGNKKKIKGITGINVSELENRSNKVLSPEGQHNQILLQAEEHLIRSSPH